MGKTAYGEGSVYQRADGRWSAQLDMGWRNGKRQRKLIYGPTRREVQNQPSITMDTGAWSDKLPPRALRGGPAAP